MMKSKENISQITILGGQMNDANGKWLILYMIYSS